MYKELKMICTDVFTYNMYRESVVLYKIENNGIKL